MATILQKANRMAIIDLHPYLDIFQYVRELPYHAHEWHILSAWQLRRPHCMRASCQMISKLPMPSSNLWHAFEQKQLPHRDMGVRTTVNDLFMMPATFNCSPRDPHIQGSYKNCKIKFWLSCTMQPVEDENHVSGTNEVDDHPQEYCGHQ